MEQQKSLLNVKPCTAAPLDGGFVPPVLAWRAYCEAVRRADGARRVRIAIPADQGRVCRWEADVLPEGTADADTARMVERVGKFLLWSHGGHSLLFSGPEAIGQALQEAYAPGGARAFDAEMMQRVYGRPFRAACVPADELPESSENASALGGHLDGCRIGFDLGASDYKISAVKDGEAVFTEELPWNPKDEPDPAYHYDHIQSGLKLAAGRLPRVDAIGGSAAGVYVDNRVRVASLFRSIAPEKFATDVEPMFLRLAQDWGVPLDIVNDGEVTALAGGMSLGVNAILGIAMGSSEAGGYLDKHGRITGRLNELAFAPVDMNPGAAVDEWSGDRGVGAMYFSQQAVNKLVPAAGLEYPQDMPVPERLKAVQKRVDAGHAGARGIFETIGVYLGYTLAWYAEFYELEHVLILGRVTSGEGGNLVLGLAQKVLKREFPELAERIALHVPDEKSRRVGQAVAAASLPEIG